MADPFANMTDEESVRFQLKEWVKGNSLHNKVRDECCPDFSCCGSKPLDKNVRERFEKAYLEGDDETVNNMLMMCLGGMLDNMGMDDVYIAGDAGHEEH